MRINAEPRRSSGGWCIMSAERFRYAIKLCWLNKVGKTKDCASELIMRCRARGLPQTVNLHSLRAWSSEMCSIQDSLRKTTTLASSALIITKTVWGLFAPVMCIQAKIKSPSVQCEWKHYWAYLGKLSKLSLPDYVQFHPRAPEGLCLGIRAVSFSLTHPPAHKFTHTNTPVGHDPSGSFLLLWFPMSDKGARAG